MGAETCLASTELVALLEGAADDARVQAHVRSCPACAELVSTLLDDAPATAPLPSLDLEGARFGDVVVGPRVGAGQFGEVYRGRDEAAARDVALKVVPTPGGERERYLAELQHLARVRHPHVAAVYGATTIDDEHAGLVLEWIEGRPLHEHVAALGWRPTLALFIDVAEGLAAIHAAGVVHGDLKPDNVIVDETGRAVIVDFGLSIGLDGNRRPVGGTPAYVAPEVVAGDAVDPRADQVSFCVALAEAVGGRRPSRQKSGAIDLDVGDAPAALDAVLRRGLASDPAARYPSMDALVDALRAHVEVVDRIRINALYALGVCAAAAVAAVAGHPLGGRPVVLVGLGLAAAGFLALAAFGKRSRSAAAFCRAAGLPALVVFVLGLAPLAASLVGTTSAYSSFVVAQLLSLAIVIPAFSRRPQLSPALGAAAAAGYVLARLSLGETLTTTWANVMPRAALMVFAGLLAWMLASVARRR